MSVANLALGFLPLVDAAPLLVAQALGFAREEGLDLTLIPAPSWSSLRDMLASGQVEAAQMLAPVPIATAMGLGGAATRLEALMVLNLNGNTIGVSRDLAARMRAGGFTFDFADARAAGLALLAAGTRLRIGVSFAFSMHRELVTIGWKLWVSRCPIGWKSTPCRRHIWLRRWQRVRLMPFAWANRVGRSPWKLGRASWCCPALPSGGLLRKRCLRPVRAGQRLNLNWQDA